MMSFDNTEGFDWLKVPDKHWWTKSQNRKWRVLMQKLEDVQWDDWLILVEGDKALWSAFGFESSQCRGNLKKRIIANNKIKDAVWEELDKLNTQNQDEPKQMAIDNPDEIF